MWRLTPVTPPLAKAGRERLFESILNYMMNYRLISLCYKVKTCLKITNKQRTMRIVLGKEKEYGVT